MTNKHNIGIFGGSGYVGSAIASQLKNFYNVKIFDVKKPLIEMPGVEFQIGDIRNQSEVTEFSKDLDVAITTAIIQIPLMNEQKKLGYEVNFIGIQNVCQAVYSNERTKGLIDAGTWHTIGERNLAGIINEEFGFRPDLVEDRARLYALSKVFQESVLRYYSSMSSKIFGVIRMGTVLGEGMPEETAANIFIDRGLKGLSITPYKHSLYRPMLYVDIADICRAYQVYVEKILSASPENSSSLSNIINLYYPEPITIIDLAKIVQEQIASKTNGTVNPKIDVVDTGQPVLFNENDKSNLRVDISKAMQFLGWNNLISPRESLASIIDGRLKGQ